MVKYKNDENTQEKILLIASEMFFSMEYEKVTLNEIAKRSGVTKGGVYHYFESKDDLLVAVLINSMNDLIGGFITEKDDNLALREILRGWFNFKDHMTMFSGEESSDYNVLFQTMYLIMLALRKKKSLAKEIGAIYEQSIEFLVLMISRAQNSGEVRKDLNPKGIAYQLVSIVEGGMFVSILSENAHLQETGDLLFETIWSQIKA